MTEKKEDATPDKNLTEKDLTPEDADEVRGGAIHGGRIEAPSPVQGGRLEMDNVQHKPVTKN